MPYIAQNTRNLVDQSIDELVKEIADTAKTDQMGVVGTLNYTITRLVLGVFKQVFGKRRYWQFPLIKGLYADMAAELQDREQRAYEDQKIKENGDLVEFE